MSRTTSHATFRARATSHATFRAPRHIPRHIPRMPRAMPCATSRTISRTPPRALSHIPRHIPHPQVPTAHGKADLTIYREAGAEVMAVLAAGGAALERASIDEAYVDVTAAAAALLQSQVSACSS